MPWMGIQDLWTFLVAVLVFLALPGPGTFTLLTATGRGGVRGGYTALAGLLVGDQILMWLALAGVAALLKANPLVFHAVQFLGAAYLVWVGISWFFFQHLLSGIRHLLMDTGWGYELGVAKLSATWTWVGSVLLTAAFWGVVLFGKGAL